MSTTKKTAAKKTATKKTAAKKPASRSGNPAKAAAAEAAALQASDISAFKQRREGAPLPLPSGLVVRAKRVELQTMIQKGNVPNPLMEVVSEALQKGQKANIEEMIGVEDQEIDLDMVNDMFDMVNRIIIESVTQPRVHAEPTVEDMVRWNERHPEQPVDDPTQLRDEDLLYVDEVDPDDKMFIYQWACGGTADIATFREEARADMATLAEKQGAKAAAK